MRGVICSLMSLTLLAGVSAAASTYQVGYGDTLWDLSIRFYGSPDYWDDILAANPSIAGPEYLVPGMELFLPEVAGLPAAAVDRSYVTSTVRSPTLAATAPMISRLRLETAGFVTSQTIPALGAVLRVNIEDQGFVSNENGYMGDLVELDYGDADGARSGMVLHVLEQGETVRDPETDAVIGSVIRVAGVVRILEVTGATSIALVEHSYIPVNDGDILVPYSPAGNVPVNTSPTVESLTAWVIAVQDKDFTDSFAYDVVYINRGRDSGLRQGDVFVLYKYGTLDEDITGAELVTADIPIAELLVLDAGSTTSSVLVTANVTADLVQAGDRIHLARRQTAGSGVR